MSENSPITKEHRWFQGEDRNLEYPVVDADALPVNCSTFTLAWRLYTSRFGGTEILEKLAPDIEVFNKNGTSDGVRVKIYDGDTVHQTTGAVLIEAGTYWYELWRTDAGEERPLATGDAVLQASLRRQEAP